MATRELSCIVVTPERALLDTKADFVAIPMYDGELGILPGRAPLIGRLGFGEMRIRQGNKTTYLYVAGGFVQVRDNTVTVLTSVAQRASEIQPDTVQTTLDGILEKLRRASGDEEQNALLEAQQKARAQMRVARHRTEDPAGRVG